METVARLDSSILSRPKRRSSWVTGRNRSSSTGLELRANVKKRKEQFDHRVTRTNQSWGLKPTNIRVFLPVPVQELLSDLPQLLLANIVPDSVQGGVAAQLPQVTARVTFGLLSDFRQINTAAQLRKTDTTDGWGERET